MIYHPRQKGFTLIELLIVVSIIALLSSIIIASLSTARDRAQNANRTQIAKEYQKALELYRNDHDGYPLTTVNSPVCIGLSNQETCFASVPGNTNLQEEIKKYIPGLPKNNEPVTLSAINFGGTLYTCLNANTNYCQSYKIEWIMEGIDTNCGGGYANNSIFIDTSNNPTNTFCQIQM